MRVQTKYGVATDVDFSGLGLRKILAHAEPDETRSLLINLGKSLGATEALLAEVFGVSDRWIRHLAASPMPDLGEDFNRSIYGLATDREEID